MIVGVKERHRLVVMGGVSLVTRGVKGLLLSGKFFPPKRAGLTRFLAHGSQNDFRSEPTTKEVSECLERLSEIGYGPNVTPIKSISARGSAEHALVRHYWLCLDEIFWEALPVRDFVMEYYLCGDSVTLLPPHSDYFLGDVARQIAEVVPLVQGELVSQ